MERRTVRIRGWNGIRDTGKESTDRLLNKMALKGYETIDCNYPRVHGLFGAWIPAILRRNAALVMQRHIDGDCAIVHSYGGLVLLETMKMGAKYKHVFMFSPAVDSDIEFPEGGAESITVFYNHNDRALAFGMSIPNHPFGGLGRKGYQGKFDPRVESIDFNLLCPEARETIINHSDYFLEPYIGRFADFIDQKIQNS